MSIRCRVHNNRVYYEVQGGDTSFGGPNQYIGTCDTLEEAKILWECWRASGEWDREIRRERREFENA